MGLRVQTNIQSLAAQRNLNTNHAALNHSLQKMSSGERITRSADDAAGLAISERIRAYLRSLAQNSRNANDGISLIQTAEGGMNEIGTILIRLRELSMQAATDTIGAPERAMIDKEVQSLREEIDRIATATEFNGRKLLTGEGAALEFQVGLYNNKEVDRIEYDPRKAHVTVDQLGLTGINTSTKEAAQQNLSKLDDAIMRINEDRSGLGALQNRIQSTVNNLQVYYENLAAAKSRIRDADFAHETSELTRNNILAQANTAMLVQANQNPQLALSLLS